MIARLRGRLLEKTPEAIVVDAGGVGYQLFVSLNSFYRLPAVGTELDVRVHTHVREDALQLYGFLDDAERALFLLLIQVSGIGPKVALAILSGMETGDLEDALAAGDVRRLVAVPGIGKKKAELMILQLKDKARLLVQSRDARDDAPARPRGSDGAEAVSALINLGYREAEAERAVANVEERGVVPLPDLIREALRRLAS
jgi:Holliday junction DNA helicase RuvA